MNTITTKDGTEIYYKNRGPRNAQPIVFHHGGFALGTIGKGALERAFRNSEAIEARNGTVPLGSSAH